MSSSLTGKKVILVIGATGAQGLAVIDALLAPSPDGNPSPYAVRALTRDPTSKRAQSLADKGVECVKGSFEDFDAVLGAMKGVYGVWSNTDGFTVGEAREIYAGMRLFELAKQVGTVRHYVWSNLDYSFKIGGYNTDYKVDHHDGKGRVGEWMKAQPSVVADDGMTWSAVSTGPYMEMLNFLLFGPLHQRSDGTFVFASPIGNGRVPMIALSDVGFFARYSFDHRAEVSGKDLEVASEMVSWPELVETFQRVTGEKAVFRPLPLDQWMGLLDGVDRPVFNEGRKGDTSFRKNHSSWWRQFRDEVITRDMEWIKSINPNGQTLEGWMRETKYTGKIDETLLKNTEDGRNHLGLKMDLISAL